MFIYHVSVVFYSDILERSLIRMGNVGSCSSREQGRLRTRALPTEEKCCALQSESSSAARCAISTYWFLGHYYVYCELGDARSGNPDDASGELHHVRLESGSRHLLRQQPHHGALHDRLAHRALLHPVSCNAQHTPYASPKFTL